MANEEVVGRYEMLWDCSFCGKTKLLGITHRHCPECGAPQDQTKRYFPAEGEKVAVSDEYAGHDRSCPNCKHPNGARATFCAKCGAPLDEAAAVKRRSDQVVKKGQLFAADDARRAEAELAGGAQPAPAPKKKSWAWLYVLIVIAMAGFAIWFMCVRKRTAELEVAEQRWKRVVTIETFQDVTKDGWQHDVPAGTPTFGCRLETFETKQVKDGEDCSMRRVDKGDGTFEERQECKPKYRQEPVKRTKCKYKVKEWVPGEQREAVAVGGKEPAWPESGVQKGEAGRREARKDVYEVVLREKDKQHTCAVPHGTWTKLTAGAAAKAEIRQRSGEILCDTVVAK